jgi:hypothetical protein
VNRIVSPACATAYAAFSVPHGAVCVQAVPVPVGEMYRVAACAVPGASSRTAAEQGEGVSAHRCASRPPKGVRGYAAVLASQHTRVSLGAFVAEDEVACHVDLVERPPFREQIRLAVPADLVVARVALEGARVVGGLHAHHRAVQFLRPASTSHAGQRRPAFGTERRALRAPHRAMSLSCG